MLKSRTKIRRKQTNEKKEPKQAEKKQTIAKRALQHTPPSKRLEKMYGKGIIAIRPKVNKEQIIKVYDAIENVLKGAGVPMHYYSIGKLVDDCICFEFSNGKWIVYEGLHGNKIHKVSFDSAFAAGCRLFESVVFGNDKISRMKEELHNNLGTQFKIDE